MTNSERAQKFYEFHSMLEQACHSYIPFTQQQLQDLYDKLFKLAVPCYGVKEDTEYEGFNALMTSVDLPYRIIDAEEVNENNQGMYSIVIIDNKSKSHIWLKHIDIMMSIYQDIGDCIVSSINNLLRTFTILYNTAFHPLFRDDPNAIYTVDEMNMLMRMRFIPYYVRCVYVSDQRCSMWAIKRANWL